MEEHQDHIASKNRPTQVEYTIGVLETIYFLLNTKDQILLSENIDHAKKIIPRAISQLNEI
jgi:hypothetical protein